MKLRCLGAVHDDLHDYAESIFFRMDDVLRYGHEISFADFDLFEGTVLHRDGQFQAELIFVPPGVALPSHRHPLTDSVDLLVGGNVDEFRIGRHRIRGFVPDIGLRIPSEAAHGGRAAASGVSFLSCQRWRGEPSHIGNDWLSA